MCSDHAAPVPLAWLILSAAVAEDEHPLDRSFVEFILACPCVHILFCFSRDSCCCTHLERKRLFWSASERLTGKGARGKKRTR